MSQTLTYTIEAFDFEGSNVSLIQYSTLASFMTLTNFTYTFSPDYTFAQMQYMIYFDLTDGANIVSESFTLTVVNSPPVYS